MCTRRTEAILVIAEELRRVHGPEIYSAGRCRISNLKAANVKIEVGVEPSSARSEAHFGSHFAFRHNFGTRLLSALGQ